MLPDEFSSASRCFSNCLQRLGRGAMIHLYQRLRLNPRRSSSLRMSLENCARSAFENSFHPGKGREIPPVRRKRMPGPSAPRRLGRGDPPTPHLSAGKVRDPNDVTPCRAVELPVVPPPESPAEDRGLRQDRAQRTLSIEETGKALPQPRDRFGAMDDAARRCRNHLHRSREGPFHSMSPSA